MPKPEVLARVKSDLALGHTHLAIRRLRTLITADPDDLEVRALLAIVYRQTGNLVEAGRWAYLSDEVRPAELAAFERAHPSPWMRLRLLRVSGRMVGVPVAARHRLDALVAEAERVGPPPIWTEPSAPRRRHGVAVPCLFVVVTLGAFGALVALGGYEVLHWLLH
ncbi:MAG: tetratricopeptide repeat protein [Micromonosporaceae bacterium]|nr:tetratricopeptide repeat protein [Micromonosporaceae bacterium]